jgi:vancomycin aglycone glucosyltransferase
MKVLLSSIGTRGDVQPILALACELRAIGHEPRLCVAPNFKEWVESHGLACIPIGPDLKQWMSAASTALRPSPEQLRQLAAHTVREQFQVVGAAADGCDLIVGGGVLQIAASSIAEMLGVPYIFAAYAPVSLPSPDHPPPKIIGPHHSQSLTAAENHALWVEEEQSWNDRFGTALNEERAKASLAPVESVYRHIITDRPWLAADPVIAPAPSTPGLQIVQTGAWLPIDDSALPAPLEHFLASGEPPVYFGFGSMRGAEQTSGVLIEAARTIGRRAIFSQGWGNLRPIDAASDCMAIEDVNHAKLFPRVAAVVHHGGGGTTATAARAGAAQVIVPHNYDQHYWAHRMQKAGAGISGPPREQLTANALVTALREALQPRITARAQALAGSIERHGARIAAERLTSEFA